jgi:hypothetical protein
MKEMTNFKHTLSLLAAAAVMVVACEKKVAPIDSYGVTVDFKAGNSKNLVGDVSLNPKDSIILDFAMASSLEDMAVIEIQKNGAKIDTFNVSGNDKRSFSGTKRYVADSIAGDYTYRIFARNKKGVYIGDGSKSIKVTINPDFIYWSFKSLAVPDSVAKANKSFFNSSTGDVLSYLQGEASSSKIDFGYFYDTTTAGAPKHTFYALGASKFVPHDLSAWTKNATIFKKATSPAFNTLTSGSALLAAGLLNLKTGATTTATALASGNLVYFKTAAGKYGCIQINYINDFGAIQAKTFVNIDVKVQK